MDNECSSAVEKYIRSKSINIQLDPPHNHQANATERAIAPFKEHFIAALATVDMLCPLQLWDDFLPKVELTVNMLCFSRQNPKKSANQEVYGSFDFNKTPLAPLGTKALVYNNPGSQSLWAPHANNGFYVEPGLRPLPMPPILHSCNVPLPLLQHLVLVPSSLPSPSFFAT